MSKPSLNGRKLKNYVLSLGKEKPPRKGLRSWDPYEYMSLALGIILVCVIGGWWIGDSIFSSSKTDNQYVDSEPMDADSMGMHVSPLTMENFNSQNGSGFGQAVARPPNPDKVAILSHEVETGESLWSISQNYHITLDTLASANPQYAQTQLKPGITLKIPSQDGLCYKVESGKTMETIAKQFSVPVEKIVLANGLTENQSLIKNQELFIPGAKPKRSLLASQSGFGWPAAGHLTSGFGYRQHPMGGGSRFHRGVDIAAEYGTTIYAAQAGKVVYAGWYGLMGKCVVIQHSNEYVSYYAHCSRTKVQPGQWVKRGQAIAQVGNTGLSTGSHVHFEIRRNGVPVNPLRFLR